MSISRRKAIMSIPASALLSLWANAESPNASNMTVSQLYKFEDAPEKFNAYGGGNRPTLPKTVLPSGEVVGVHVGTIPAGKTYSPLHANANAEFLIVHQGKMEFLKENAPPKLAQAGDVIYAVAQEKHSLRNPGDSLTIYFVIAIGGPRP